MPLWRVGVFVRTLHPDIFGRNFIWKPGAEVEVGTVDFDILDTPEFKASPLAIVFREGNEVRARIGRSRQQALPDRRGHARRRRHRLHRAADPVYRRLNSRLELDHEAAGRLHRGAAEPRCASLVRAAGADDRDHQLAPHRRRCCSTPMSATAPASGSWAARSAAAIPRRCMPRSGCRICAALPRCRTGCRPRPSSISSINISTARSPRSGRMAARC